MLQTKIEGNSVVLMATKEELETVKRTKGMCPMANENKIAPVVIVGGGLLAESLCRNENCRLQVLRRKRAPNRCAKKVSRAM
jgi:hypothetical protein